jgi:hypothetical protein
MANPGPAQAGIPNTELYVSNGPMSRIIYPTGFTNGNAIGNGTLSFNYFNCTYPISASRLDCLLEMSQATAATTATGAALVTCIGGIYQTSASTNTAGTTNYVNLLSAASATYSWTWASNSAGSTQFSYGAIRPLSVPLNVNMQQGEYLVAFGISTTNSSVGLSTTALAHSMSVQVCSTNQTAINYAELTAATNASSNLWGGWGVYSAATGALPNTAPITAINQTGANAADGQFAFVMRNY